MIHICYPCCHSAKCKHYLYSSIDSVAKYNKNITVSLLNSIGPDGNMEFNDDDIEIYRQILAKHGIKTPLRVFDVSLVIDKFHNCRPLKGQWNAYKRLLIHKIYNVYMPKVKRVLYLDEDTVCIGSLKKLYNENMKGRPYMGFIDGSIYKHQIFTFECKLTNNNDYINSGVLLIDVTYDIDSLLKELVPKAEKWHKFFLRYLHDQTIINACHPAYFECSMIDMIHGVSSMKYYTDIINATIDEYNIIHYWGHKKRKNLKTNDKVDRIVRHILNTAPSG